MLKTVQTINPGSVAITGGTINNTSIGGTTPSAGAFTTLSVSGAATLSAGTVNGILYLNATKQITSGTAFGFTGTQILFGTQSTAFITGFSGGSTGLTLVSGLPTICLVDDEDTTNDISWIANSSGDMFISNKNTAGNIIFSNAGAQRMRVKAGGQVRFMPLAADPAGAETGDVYYNSGANKLRVYNGTSWIDLH